MSVLSDDVVMKQLRGLKENLPTSAPDGQLIITTDTKELFFGTGTSVEQFIMTSSTYTFTQATELSTWTINHNLGKYPSIMSVNNNGTQIFGENQYVDANQIVIKFSKPLNGVVYLN